MENMKRKLLLTLLLVVLTSTLALARIVTPVTWTKSVKMTDAKHGVVTLTASIKPGWHLYGTNIPDGGPERTTFTWDVKGARLVGKPEPSKALVTQHDATFDMDLSWWTGTVSFRQKFEVTAPEYTISGSVHYMSCNDETCSAPTDEPIYVSGKAPAGPAAQATAQVQAAAPVPEATGADTAIAAQAAADGAAMPAAGDSAAAAQAVAAAATPDAQLWAPVRFSSDTAGDTTTGSDSSLWYIFWACFLGGLLALLTPCVWPMIPMTVSFFLKQSGSRAKSVSNAVTYGLSIIVIFLLLGVLFTAIFGASALNALATNAVCNIIFFLLLVVFAISFFGAFELRLPDSWSNKMDATAEKTTGLLSIFFMAATLVIVSFSCTGPIIGTLLVEAASQGSMLGPVVGMTGFSIALAIPFALFALFPSVLKKLPKSGGWLNTVKVVLGFIELALSLKFLSVADLAYGWHVLDRETFLALWIAIFGAMSLYLFGLLRFKSDGESRQGIGVTRFFFGLISLAFTAYLVPGLWGAPLKATSAFVPPLYTQDFNLYGGTQEEYDDYDAGMAAAAKLGKPVLVDFSGYGCVNCRKMEGAVLDDDKIKKTIADKFVTIKLMVDDKKPLDKPMVVNDNGRQMTLKTVGDKWSYLQRHKFDSNSQPYYVVLDTKGQLLSGPFAYKEDIPAFQRFLDKGWKK